MAAVPPALCQCGKKFKHIGACKGVDTRAVSRDKPNKFLVAIGAERTRLQAAIGTLRSGIKRQQDELVAIEAKLEGLRAATVAYESPKPDTMAAVPEKSVTVPFRMAERASKG